MPYFGFHTRLLLIGGLGYLFDAMDAAVIAFVLPVLKQQWQLTDQHIGLLAAAAAIGGFLGALVAGRLGDLLGRRVVMMWALAVYGLASLGSAFSSSWTEFLTWRIVAGIGIYAESAIIAPYLAEFAAPAFRGRYIGSLTGFFSFGFVAAAALGYFLVPLAPEAWRYALVITALPIAMLLWWRRSLPESPRWLESQGRLSDAETVVSRIEAEFERSLGKLPPVPPLAHDPRYSKNLQSSPAVSFKSLFRPPLLRPMSMALTVWFAIGFSYYAFFTWLPSLLVANGMTLTKSYGFSLAIYVAQIPGYFTAAWLNDAIGRRKVIVLYLSLASVCALGLALARVDGAILAAGLGLSFFMNGTYAGLYTYTPELFPTRLRSTAHGTASSLSRVGAVASPIMVGYVFPLHGFIGVFGMTCGILVAGAAAVLLLGESTRNRSLEQIGAR
jgi:putative MFS transporter